MLAGYEDAWYYLWRERRLPVNVDPLDAELDDAQERDAAARASSSRGSTRVVGYALPLRARPADRAAALAQPAPGSCARAHCS